MKAQFNLFGFDLQLYVSRPRIYVIYLRPVSDMYEEPSVHTALTRIGAWHRAWSLARLYAGYERKSYVYEIYRCDMDFSDADGALLRRRVVHQETRSCVSFFSSKPLSK